VTARFGVALSLALAALAGLAAEAIGAPLPWLLGPLVASAVAAMSDFRPFGVEPRMPVWSRPVFTPVIGVGIGATVTPQILDQAARWWPSLIGVALFVVLVQLVNFAILRRLGGFDRPTAFFAASPGGLVDSVLIGEARGGDVATMATMHLTRIALAVAAVPLILTFAVAAQG
jgi:membrane AbrB-like protein